MAAKAEGGGTSGDDSTPSGRAADSQTLPVGAPPKSSSTSKVSVGQQLGRYVVLEVLGQGAMGEVLRAYDPKLRRELAIKHILPTRLGRDAETRLVREAQAMAQLGHPNVVAVFDVEVTDQGVLVAMEYVRGGNLEGWLSSEPDWRDIVRVFIQAGRGLQSAHEAGLVHRDFKPANVLVAEDGRVRVADFGLVKVAEPSRSAIVGMDDDDSLQSDGFGPELENIDANLTAADVVVGTPRYMAPEQHAGPAGAAADQFAFCVALWEALVGLAPYQARNMRALAEKKGEGPPAWPRDGNKTPRRVVNAIRHGLAPYPEDRYPSMAALVDELERATSARRRNLRLVLGGLGGAAVLAAVLGQAGADDKCTGAREQIEQRWSAATRDDMRRAFSGSGAPTADTAYDRATARIDAFAEDWVARHRDACEATAVRGEQSEAALDLRMGCLSRARGELGAVVGVLVQADATTVERSHRLLESLPSLDRCDDVAALQQDVAAPPPGPVADAVVVAREDLARSRALYRIGRYEQSLALADAVAARTRNLDYPVIHAEVALGRGDVLDYLGRYDECETELNRALEIALRERAFDVAIKAASSQVYVVGIYQGRPQEARWLGKIALDMALGVDADPVLEARARNAMATVHRMLAQWDEAEAMARENIRQLSEAVGERDSRVATLLGSLSAQLTDAGLYDRAEPELLRAYTLRKSLFGPNHPDTANSASAYGFALYEQGRFAEAEMIHREALRARIEAHGPDHFFTARARAELAVDLIKLGRAADALPELDAGLEGLDASMPEDHPGYVDVHKAYAHALMRLGRLEGAEVRAREAVRIADKAYGPEAAQVGRASSRLCEVLVERGALDEAVEAGRTAIKALEGALGDRHPMTMRARAILAEAHLARGEREPALQLLEVSWGYHDTGPIGRDWRARVAFALARALGDPATTPRARELATKAVADYEAAGPGFVEERDRVQSWIEGAEAVAEPVNPAR